MRSYTKVLFAALLAVLIMSMAGGVASANRSLSLNNGGVRTFDYSGRYTFAEPGGEFSVICTIRRHITFTRDTVAKVERTVIGTASLSLSACSGGSVRLLEPTNWTVKYLGFTGTLPAISTVRLQIDPGTRGGFLLEVFFGIARCLYGAPVNGIATVSANGEITEIRAEEAPNRPTVESLSGIACPEGILRGLLVRLEAGSPNIRLRLV